MSILKLNIRLITSLKLMRRIKAYAIQKCCDTVSILCLMMFTLLLLLYAKSEMTQIFRSLVNKKAALVAALFLSGCVSVRTVDIITVNASDNKVATDNTVKPVNNKLKPVCDALRQRLGDNAKLPPSC